MSTAVTTTVTTSAARPQPPAIVLTTQHKPAGSLSFGRSLAVETRKLTDSVASRWILIIGGVLTLLVLAVIVFANVMSHRFAVDKGLPTEKIGWMDMSIGSSQLVLMVLALLGILLATAEFSQRTALTTFALQPRRLSVLASKTVVVLVGSLLIAALSYPVGALLSVITDALTHQGIDWSWSWAKFGGFLLVAVLAGLGGLAFGLLTLSTPAAIILWFVVPMLLGFATAFGAMWSPLGKVMDWLSTSSSTGGLIDGKMTPKLWGQFATSNGLWVVVPAAIGVWRWLTSEVK